MLSNPHALKHLLLDFSIWKRAKEVAVKQSVLNLLHSLIAPNNPYAEYNSYQLYICGLVRSLCSVLTEEWLTIPLMQTCVRILVAQVNYYIFLEGGGCILLYFLEGGGCILFYRRWTLDGQKNWLAFVFKVNSSIYLSIYLSISLSLSIQLSISQSNYLSLNPTIYLSIHLSIYPMHHFLIIY